MKAIAIDDFGAEPSLHGLSIPQPGEGEALVRVRASSVNGFDLAVASGAVKDMMEYRLPIVLGKDFAGTVESTGPGVPSLDVGDEVFGVLMKPTLGDGTFAEYVAVMPIFAAKIPEGLAVTTAGTLGLAGAAALAAIDTVAPTEGETVLVSGATGGVGAFVVQLAAARGAEVIATAVPGDEERRLRDLGAHHVVDHTADLTAAVFALRPDGVHSVVHLAGDGLELADLLIPGGRIASTLGLNQDQLGARDAQATPIMALPSTETLDRLAFAVIAGELNVPIQATYTFADVPRALTDFAAGTRGKLSVIVE